MYVLLIFHNQDCSLLNAIWLYDTLIDVSKDTNQFIKYGDINRINRVYRTSKSFFRLLKINKDDANLYFR